MKKRLRKKRRLCEFKETGFEVTARFESWLSVDAGYCYDFVDQIIEVAEKNDLSVGGGYARDIRFVVATKKKYSRTPRESIEPVIAVLRAFNEVTEIRVGQEFDLNHD